MLLGFILQAAVGADGRYYLFSKASFLGDYSMIVHSAVSFPGTLSLESVKAACFRNKMYLHSFGRGGLEEAVFSRQGLKQLGNRMMYYRRVWLPLIFNENHCRLDLALDFPDPRDKCVWCFVCED